MAGNSPKKKAPDVITGTAKNSVSATHSQDAKVQQSRLGDVMNTLWLEGMDPATRAARIQDVFNTLSDIEPQDEFERMLVSQMVAGHHAAMECLRRASISNQTFDGRDMSLKHAEKLMAMYAKQLDTLNKHRGKGQQKVTVEHVHVGAGGQAIVGNIESSKSDAPNPSPKAIEHNPGVAMGDPAPAKPAKTPAKRKR